MPFELDHEHASIPIGHRAELVAAKALQDALDLGHCFIATGGGAVG
jgi:hypothetical protein